MILSGYPLNELDRTLEERTSSWFSYTLAFPLPDEIEEIPVPAEESIWLGDQERLLPGSESAGERDKEEPFCWFRFWAFDLAVEYDQLLTKECILEQQF